MKIFDARGYLTCLTNAINNHTFASLTSRSEHLLKNVTYVTWLMNELGNFLGSKR